MVFTTPAIRALRHHYPDAFISYVVEPLAAPVVRASPYIDDLIVAPRANVIADLALGRRLRAQRYDVAVDFHSGPRGSLLTWLSGAARRIGYAVPGRGWMYTTRVARPRELRPRHAVLNQWDLIGTLGIAAPDPSSCPVEMPADPAAVDRVADRLARAGVDPGECLVVVHVSAGNPFRRWPQSAFGSLVAALASREARTRVIVTSGPSERAAVDQVIAEARAALADAWRERVVAAGDFSLAELRALLDRAALFIGGDSGPMHVAATSGVPIVAVYGPTLPVRSGPWRDPALVTESVETSGLPCRPCDQRVCAPGDFRCLTRIAPDDVMRAAEHALARARQRVD